MQLQRITSKIDAALRDEEQHGRLASLVWDVSRSRGVGMTDENVREIVAFVSEYVRHVPHYIEKGLAAASQHGFAQQMQAMVKELESYWLNEQDIIPDHLGLVGLMDDAYASLLLLQSVSEYCARASGVPLIAEDLSTANRNIRALIGEPHSTEIDSRVGVTLTQGLMQNVINLIAGQLSHVGGPMLGPDRSWGGMTLDDYVDTQLGAMGVV